jgi:endo-1,4-beta-xylanase
MQPARLARFASLALLALAACGGGSGTPVVDPPTAPTGPTLRSLADGKILVGAAVAVGPLRTDAAYQARLAEQYNVLVPENAMKFDQLETSRDSFFWTDADYIVQFAQDHGMVVRGHCLLWHQQSGWLWDASFNLKSGVLASDLPAILQNHVTKVVTHFQGKVAYWDVVNEAIADNLGTGLTVEQSIRNDAWAKYYPGGKLQWIEDAFTFAHAADPDAKLFYNEYGAEGVIGWGNKSAYTLALVQRLIADKVPISGVGLQMHIDAGGYPLNQDFAGEVKKFTDLGLEVHVTELDVRLPVDSQGQASGAALDTQKGIYEGLLSAALANPKATAFLTWGLDDGHSWIPYAYHGFGAGLPFDASYGAKPAFYGMQEALQAVQ